MGRFSIGRTSGRMWATAALAVIGLAAVFCIGCGDGDKGTGLGGGGGGTFTDSRDGKTYKKVKIGTQTWMAENLDRATANSMCYENCVKYGRLYTWPDAKTACPSGWHLPRDAEWQTLVDYAGGDAVAGGKLKSTSGWSNNGTNAFGFSALPGGAGDSDGGFDGVGSYGFWWSATESSSSAELAWFRNMISYLESVLRFEYYKTSLMSVRCVQN